MQIYLGKCFGLDWLNIFRERWLNAYVAIALDLIAVVARLRFEKLLQKTRLMSLIKLIRFRATRFYRKHMRNTWRPSRRNCLPYPGAISSGSVSIVSFCADYPNIAAMSPQCDGTNWLLDAKAKADT